MNGQNGLLHLLTGPSAAEALRAMLPEDEVLEVMEDFSHGPLADADAIDPQARVAWWNRLWWSMRWLPDIDEAFLQAYWQCRKRLFLAFGQRQPLCLWLGDGAHDRLLLDMACAHAHASQPLSVVEVSGKVAASHHGHVALGMYDEDALRPLLSEARLLSVAERECHAAEWAYWQETGRGWRELTGQAISELAADCFDDALLAVLRDGGEQAAARVVGVVMGRHQSAFVPDTYLFWRLSMLAEAGRVALTPQPEGPPRAALA